MELEKRKTTKWSNLHWNKKILIACLSSNSFNMDKALISRLLKTKEKKKPNLTVKKAWGVRCLKGEGGSPKSCPSWTKKKLFEPLIFFLGENPPGYETKNKGSGGKNQTVPGNWNFLLKPCKLNKMGKVPENFAGVNRVVKNTLLQSAESLSDLKKV